jgi:NAD(P)-dependent dehydrogenase (short-subunit alcohol dehydrogenase family)
MLLADKVIFLTGGSTGIGFECAKKYIQHGAMVVLVSNNAASVNEAVAELGSKSHGIVCDIRYASEVEEAIGQTLQRFGNIHIIHNNAGIAHPSKPLHETTDEEWQDLMDTNLKGILYTTRFGLEALKQTTGCIINTSSLVGEIGQDNHAAYAATKGAVNALTKSMALDYAPHKIRVNAVAPAGVWTDMLRAWSKEQWNARDIEKYLDDIHPLGDCPEGDVIADVCVFLASDMARFITGTIMPVSGGAELGYRVVHDVENFIS